MQTLGKTSVIQSIGSDTTRQTIVNAAGSVVSALTREALGGKVDFQSVFADIAGNLIANSVVASISGQSGLTDKERAGVRAQADKANADALVESDNSLQASLDQMLGELTNNPVAIPDVPMPEINFGPDTYTVQAGDALEKIARANGMGPEGAAAIAHANGLGIGATIRPGLQLTIPTSYDQVAALNEYGTYLASFHAADAANTTAGGIDFMAAVTRDIANGAQTGFSLVQESTSSGYQSRSAALIEQRASIDQFAAEMEGSVLGDLGANTLRLFGHGGNTLFQGANAIAALLTDRQYFSDTVAGVSNLLAHRAEAYDSAVSSMADFYALSTADKATAFGEGGMNFLVGGGASDLAGMAGAGALKFSRSLLEEIGSGPLPGGFRSQIGSLGDTSKLRPPSFAEGVSHEEERLASYGLDKNYEVWRPSDSDLESQLFKDIVGKPKFTSSGQPVGTIFDSTADGYLEVKSGASSLSSTYQLRLQTYRSVVDQTLFTLDTTRPINSTFENYLRKWGVNVIGSK